MIIIPSIELPHPDRPPPPGARDPRELINEWQWLGFQGVHVIEPAASDRRPLNRRESEELIRDVHHHIEVQVAGDIHSADDVDALFQAGAARVVLGGRAIDEPDWLGSTVSAFPESLVVESSARERRVRSRGWVRTLPVDVRDLANELSGYPLAGLLIRFPDDAPIEHADLALVEDLTDQLPFPVLVAGGLQSLGTLRDLEFRGVHATLIGAARLGDVFDEQTLARGFVE